MTMNILPFGYRSALRDTETGILSAVRRVLHSGKLVLGPETGAFEEEFSAYIGAARSIGVHSGTVALHLALWASGIGPGDEVITVANTCPPTISAIRLAGAVPVFADVDAQTAMMDPADAAALISPRTKAILPVHLWGMCVDMDAVNALADRHGLTVIEDCAQAHGSAHRGRRVGTLGNVGCFSFYPTKNIGAYGDAGAICTNDADLADRIRAMRMYGYDSQPGVSTVEGMNARINEVQAAILRIQLRRYESSALEKRLTLCAAYRSLINNPLVRLPVVPQECSPTYHQFVVRCRERDALKRHLEEQGVICGIHYATPIHRMPAFAPLHTQRPLPNTERICGEILSLPLHTDMTADDAQRVAQAVNSFNP